VLSVHPTCLSEDRRAQCGATRRSSAASDGTGNEIAAIRATQRAFEDRKPTGNRGQTNAPTDIFRAKDGWVFAQVVGQPLFQRWAKLMGEDHWLSDPRFKDDISRGDNAGPLCERMSVWCAERSTGEILDVLATAKIPAAPVLRPQQTLDDPHVQAMGFFRALDYPGRPGPRPSTRGHRRFRDPGPNRASCAHPW
jgi:crotonobetainyl-CoA:carnitine CoA-transferase CaiB-like acyl-CoA transferase